ncbi:alkaline phosphatase family protein [Sphingomonas sp. PB2P12]|uniref:alkaline phosphatase family protein n=1 Tax=Sphingomonas sandaracina TaxID=3096157 RepID=UPI002FCB0835
MAVKDIDTIVYVMLENRSFDHMLGYLSLDETARGLPVDGLRSDKGWQWPWANLARGAEYPIRRIRASQPIEEDPPHGRDAIGAQIDTAPRGPGQDRMGGFVDTYIRAHKHLADPGVVMGHYVAEDVPTFDFLARNFCVCDRWFTPLPLGTQANRLMAMSGTSRVVDNVTGLPDQQLVYDWLEERGVPWRVYVSGGFTPFFIMMRRWALKIVGSIATGRGPFRRFSGFRRDWQSVDPMPSVIFIEPEYADAPMSNPNDDHPPTPISKGQDFVRQIYDIVSSNPDRWARTLMIVTYDEHGGFFDHVPPPDLETTVGDVTFRTLGPRVPALLVSPHVGEGAVFSEQLDHTSVLELIAERFGGGSGYSEVVSERQSAMGRIVNALLDEPRTGRAPAMPPRPRAAGPMVATVPQAPTAPQTPNAAAIDAVMREMAAEHPALLAQPGWSEMRTYIATNAPPVPQHRDHIGDAGDT